MIHLKIYDKFNLDNDDLEVNDYVVCKVMNSMRDTQLDVYTKTHIGQINGIYGDIITVTYPNYETQSFRRWQIQFYSKTITNLLDQITMSKDQTKYNL
jgi:hypothetical protein